MRNIGNIRDFIGEIAVRETFVDYVLENTVDRFSCNGLVNPTDGCVLFDDRSRINYKLGETDNSYLKFDADVSSRDFNSGMAVSDCGGACDSNVVLNVLPDRTCGQWLACQTKIKTADEAGNERDYCLDITACDSLDAKGNCNNFVPAQRQRVNGSDSTDNLTVDNSSRQLLANLSGYVTGGITLSSNFDSCGDNDICGYRPYDLMDQIGQLADVPNGDFELFYSTYQPIGWHNPKGEWDKDDFKVVADPVTAQTREGINIKEGRSILKLNASSEATSEIFDIFSEREYVLSASVNTLNLKPAGAEAVIKIRPAGPTTTEQVFEDGSNEKQIRVKAGQNWQGVIDRFVTGDFSQVKISLKNSYGDDRAEGASYFDQITVRPALEIQSPTPVDKNKDGQPDDNNYIPSACRIYPESDSLSCSYSDDSLLKHRGLLGYCLVSDPLQPDVCLQWWPVDLIKDDFFDLHPGYQDRSPQYYCLKMSNETIPVYIGSTGDQSPTGPENAWIGSWTFNVNGQYNKPNFITIEEISSFGESGYSFGNLKLDPSNNWEVGWFAELTDDFEIPGPNNYQYTDFCNGPCGSVYYPTTGTLKQCTGFFDPDNPQTVEINEQTYVCQDNTQFSSIADVINGPTYGKNTKVPDRLIEQALNGGFGPEGGAILTGVERAKLAVTDSSYCLRNYQNGLDNYRKTVVWVKANFDFNNNLLNIAYGACDNTSSRGGFRWNFHFHYAYCEELVQVVTSAGQNKAWLSRVSEGSDYVVDLLGYTFGQDYEPFGSIVYPNPSDNPSAWDSKPDSADNRDIMTDDILYLGNQPLFIEGPDFSNFEEPGQVRGGSPYSCIPGDDAACFLPDRRSINITNTDDAEERLRLLFAQSYGMWRWNPEGGANNIQRVCVENTPLAGQSCFVDDDCCPTGVCPGACELIKPKYTKVENYAAWSPPDNLCVGNIRPIWPNDWCGVAPVISEMTTEPANIITPNGFGLTNLKFNVVVNPDQLPLKYYQIDWGDGNIVSVSGTTLRDRTHPEQPYTLTHAYSYYDILGQNILSQNPLLPDDGIYCAGDGDASPPSGLSLPPNSCAVQPKIQAFDNWGWCNGRIDLSEPEQADRVPVFGTEWGYFGNACTPESEGNPNAWTHLPGYIIVGVPQ